MTDEPQPEPQDEPEVQTPRRPELAEPANAGIELDIPPQPSTTINMQRASRRIE